MSKKKQQTIKKLVKMAQDKGLDASNLDSTVHEYKSEEASRINNGGLEAQIEYLLEETGEECVKEVIQMNGREDS